VADSFPFQLRLRGITDINAATALGISLGTVLAGVLAGLVNWRAAFLLTALIAGAGFLLYGGLPEPERQGPASSSLARVRRVLAEPWALLLCLLAIPQGALLSGFITFFAPALQAHGETAATAGLVMATYGVSTLLASRVVKRFAGSVPAYLLMIVGGFAMAAGYLVAAATQTVLTVLVAGVGVGIAFAFLHSTLQTWITEVVPDARGTATALFAATLFTGAAVGTALVAPFAQQRAYGALFLVAAAVSLFVTLAAALARRRYRPGEPPIPRSD
jgi:predicted MFS family arabinose efflux permease